MMYKRGLGIGLLVMLGVICLSIVSFGATTITVWTVSLSPAFDNYINQVNASFKDTHSGIDVKWVDIPYSALAQKLTAAIAAAQPPDVVNLNTAWVIDFASAGGLSPVDKYFSIVDQYNFWDGLWNANVLNGHPYAVPWYMGTVPVLIYNREIFKAAGLDPNKPPTTWQEMTEYAKTIKEKTGAYGFCPSIVPTRELFMIGVPLVTPDGKKAAFNVPATAKRLQWYQMLYQEELMPRDLGGYTEARQLFGSKQLAMYITGISQLKHIQLNSPDVFTVTDVAPAPVGPNGIPVSGWGWSIPYNASHPTEGGEYIRYVTSPYWQVEFSKLASVVPSTKVGLQTDPWFLKRMDNIQVKAQAVVSKALCYAKDPDAPSVTGVPPAKFAAVRRAISQCWIPAIKGQYTVETALKLAEDAVNEILAGK